MNYLLATRGETLSPYFKFLKEAGQGLDPKTRSLLSLIAKVHSQSESGLRQYLPRAMRDGVSAGEVIDALLFSLPMLGLTRINWAIDIILQMDIPEFSVALIDQPEQWQDIAGEDELIEGEAICRKLPERGLFLLRKGKEIKAYDSRCPHQLTDIPEQALEKSTVTCPKHQWAFNLQTGDCIAKGRYPLKAFATRITAAGRVEVFC